MTICILCHNFSPQQLANETWEHVVWGSPTVGIYGRGSFAAKLFLKLHTKRKDPIVYFGNGSFVSEDGLSEAEYLFKFVQHHLSEIDGFDETTRQHFEKCSIREKAFGQNTRAEIIGCLTECEQKQIRKVILVTSPFHAPRSLRDALLVRAERKLNIDISTYTAHTDPDGDEVSNVKIVEPCLYRKA